LTTQSVPHTLTQLCHVAQIRMAGAGTRGKSRLDEVNALLALMKAQGITNLKVGDIELTLAPSGPVVPPDDEAGPKPNPELAARRLREEYRRVALGASGRIVQRASNE
jgi:hypothetical protein